MPTTRKKKVHKRKKNITTRSKLSPKRTPQIGYKKKKNIAEAKNRRPRKCRSPQKCDSAIGINRLLAPFNKFYKKTEQIGPFADSNMLKNNPKTTLTPKEKNYLICSCQQRTSRYARLKCLAAEAEQKNKIFLMNGNHKAIRNALYERGWVEKIPPARMDLSTIRNKKFNDESEMHLALERLLLSNLVERSLPTFIWNMKNDFESENLLRRRKVIHNRIHSSAPLWSTKQGLCSSIRNNYWYYIEGVAEVVSPRTYNSSDEGEKDEFITDYKLTACTSLLKWVLSMVANDQPIFVEAGNISINVILFALNRSKEYLYQKQHKDIDESCSHVTTSQWSAFLKKYYILIAKQDTFRPDENNRLPLYLRYAKFMIKEIHKYRPQLSCEGCHNIWIIKPAHCSRGRGIRMASTFAVLTDLLKKDKYVFQKYIEESMLIHETKFDVRQYYLVTSTYPLVIWMYQDCYLKFSSQKYNLKNYHESIHLTNNAVQRKYKNCTNRHPELPQQNMWNLTTFKEYLNKSGRGDVWDTVIYPGMKKSIVGIMLSCQESASYWKNRFELYGCDFILDKECKPWLIEINSGPDLNPTTKVTAEICPAVLSDIIKVVIDREENPKASTGKFECIYRQNLGIRPCGRTDNLMIQGYALPYEYFNKGDKQDINEDYSLESVNKQPDIAHLLKKMKMSHASEKTDCSGPTKDKNKSLLKVNFKNTSSHEQVKNIAATISDKLDSLLEHITSCDSPFTSYHPSHKSGSSVTSSPSSNNFRHSAEREIEAADAIEESLLVKPYIHIESDPNVNVKFDFSELDDKGSGQFYLGQNENKSSLNPNYGTHPKASKGELRSCNSVSETKCKMILTDSGGPKEDLDDAHDFMQSTKKIFSFLNHKRKEYIADL